MPLGNQTTPITSYIQQGDWQRSNLWDVQIVSAPPVLGTAPELFFQMQTFSLPSSDQEIIVEEWGGQSYPYSGKDETPKSLECTLRMSENMVVYDYLNRHHILSGHREDGSKYPKVVYALGEWALKLYSQDRSSVTAIWTFYNLWIPKLGVPTPDKKSSAFMTATATIAFDYALPSFRGGLALVNATP